MHRVLHFVGNVVVTESWILRGRMHRVIEGASTHVTTNAQTLETVIATWQYVDIEWAEIGNTLSLRTLPGLSKLNKRAVYEAMSSTVILVLQSPDMAQVFKIILSALIVATTISGISRWERAEAIRRWHNRVIVTNCGARYGPDYRLYDFPLPEEGQCTVHSESWDKNDVVFVNVCNAADTDGVPIFVPRLRGSAGANVIEYLHARFDGGADAGRNPSAA